MITPDCAAQILSAIAAYDQRTIGVHEANAWAASFNHEYPDMRLDDAIRAVVEWHATALEGRMRIAHVVVGARAIAKRRALSASQSAPGCYGIVAEFGQDAANLVRALPPGGTPQLPENRVGVAKVRAVLAEIAARRSMPTRRNTRTMEDSHE